MRRMTATLAGLFALATVSARSAPNTNSAKWVWLGSGLSFGLGDQGCGEGWHQPLRRDWRGEWYWGSCVRNR